MGKFVNIATGATFSVDDSKDDRYAGEGYKRAGAPAKKAAAKKAAAKKSSK